MRLAFVSPLAPVATGIADYAAELLELLGGAHELELFHGQDEVETSRLPEGARVHPAAQLLGRHRERPFDLAVYQMGVDPATMLVNTWSVVTAAGRATGSRDD